MLIYQQSTLCIMIDLGTIHNFQHFYKHTEHALFTYPLPPPQKRTINIDWLNLFHVQVQ